MLETQHPRGFQAFYPSFYPLNSVEAPWQQEEEQQAWEQAWEQEQAWQQEQEQEQLFSGP